MAFPVEQSAANTTQTSNAPNWGAQNMPSGIVAGDTLLALVAVDGANQVITFTGGWTKLLDGAAGSDGSVTLGVAYKKAVGSDTLSLTISSSQQGSCRVKRLDTAEDPDTQAPEIGAVTTGVSATPTVGLITPTGGAKDYKFYSVCAHDRNRAFTSAPTDYQANDATLVSGGSNGAQLSWGDRDVNASTQDPDNFTYTASDGFATVVVVVHPGASGTLFFQTNTGAITPTSTLVRETQKVVAGTVTPTSTLVRDILKALAGSLIPTGALTKETQKSFAGSLTPTSVLTSIIIFLQSAAGSLTPTGAITKQTQKNVAGSITPSGAIVKQTQKGVAGAVAAVGTVAKETQKNLDGSVTPAGLLTTSLTFGKVVTGFLTATGALATLFIEGGAEPVIKLLQRTLCLIRVTHHRNTKQR